MNTKNNIVVISATVLLFGCGEDFSKVAIQSNEVPFSVAGVVLGMGRAELEKSHKILPCDPDKKDLAKCYVGDNKKVYGFFGEKVEFISVYLHNPYTEIAKISFSTAGKGVTKDKVEKAWDLTGKCLTEDDIKNANKYDTDTSGYFVRSLNEFNLLPSGYNSFVCLTENNEFIKYSRYSDGKSAGVDIYFLKDVFVRNFEYVFKSKEKYELAKKEVNSPNTKPASTENQNSIPHGWRSFDNPTLATTEKQESAPQTIIPSCDNIFESANGYRPLINDLHRMTKIEGSSNEPDWWYEKFVGHICNGDAEEAKNVLRNGRIPKKEALNILLVLKKPISLEEPQQ